MELLAPAGSVEAFHAALEAGANAVYLGLGDFNSRIRAKNFTVRDLSALLPYAHSRNVKIYVTLNTLIKQSEIKSALNILYQLDQIGADAVIVADLGLMKLASTHFPNLRIHGSTQAAAHNSYGVETLKSLGAKRAVLARELSIDEIKATVKKSPSTEIEVFIHGALCYSISGLCLASSFIGGASGNRGKCTQVCRRKFKCVDNCGQACERCGYFFSPYDLQAVTVINKLAGAGVASLKIEGRMKSADYVHTVVKAYRDAIDFPGATDIAVNGLCFDFGRAKTMFFLDGRAGEPAIDPSRPSGTGILAGTIIEASEKSITLSTDMRIVRGDRLRVQPKNGFEGIACKAADCQVSGDNIKIRLMSSVECNIGDHVFLIGKADKSTTSPNPESPRRGGHAGPPATPDNKNIRMNFPNAAKIADSLTPPVNTNIPAPKPKLWFKADNIGWLEVLNASPCQHLIFDADINELNVLIDSPGIIKTWRSRIFIALPPFIEETKINFWRDTVKKCMAVGLQSFAISNIGHFPLVNKPKNIIADALIWCLNRFTQKELAARGVSKFVYSYEDEFLNIRNTAADTGIVPLYGNPPLFISRMAPGIDNNRVIADPHGSKFIVRTKNNLYYTLPATPMCLFAKREKLSSCGISDFLIDVSFINPDYDTANRLITGFKDGVRVDNGTIFNFKAGLH
ncbi:MAG: U32 family peptidase [Chitinispirillia bacterium]|nr:U32 family peptidase [Chitinispirillia bacterium]MCL2267567.1 U32 family peptidase [Chitinispirillia bacterium]